MISVRGITKRFGGVVALDNVSLEATSGEIVAIIGENGAGKSTLMKVLAGVHQPDAGEISLDGNAVTFKSPFASLQAGIRVIYQELSVLDNLDVASNVFLGRELRGAFGELRTREMEAETSRIMARLNLSIDPKTKVGQLSLAERQLVEIARALSMQVRLLVLDEPTSSLTLEETHKLLALVKELKQSGVTIFYVSHRLDEILQIADRVVGLRDGKNAGGLSGDEITHDAMVRLMVGRQIDSTHIGHPQPDAAVRLKLEDFCSARFSDRPINLELRAGEIFGMAGLVGSGRTELVEAVFGIEPAIGGTISIDGTTVSISNPREAIDAGICLIPEDRRKDGLSVTMSVRENISMPSVASFATAGLINRTSESEWASEQSTKFGVKTASIELPAHFLSGGNQQKVVLARWLSLNPRIILFDEPTRGVDVGARASIYDQMRALANEGAAIWMVSSDMEEILAVSDRIAVMNEGRMMGILDRDAASEESIMALAVGRQIEK